MNDFEYCNEKYELLYLEYKKMLKSMISIDKIENTESLTVTELAQLFKEEYPDKEKAIIRINSLFMQEVSLANLEELLDLLKYIKE